jgi:hypothetical protein
MASVWQSAVRATRQPRRTLTGLTFALAAFSAGVLTFPASIFAKEEPTVDIAVLVYNYAEVAPGILAGAEHQADRILNQAGVRAVWFDCSVKAGKLDEKSICRSGLGNQNIVIRLLPRHIRPRVPDFAFGVAVSPGLASVYYGDAALLADRQKLRSDLPLLLGCFVAHEIGHLLLDSEGHSPTGVMQAEWGPRQLEQALTGRMTFTPAQARNMAHLEIRPWSKRSQEQYGSPLLRFVSPLRKPRNRTSE